MGDDATGAPLLTPDDRAAARAFLQRSEVRLSTMHRVASALLSGAGIMVLLPTVERDSVVSVVRAELTGELTPERIALLLATFVSIALPMAALWLLVKELTRFYFHGEHRDGADGEEFLPRFTLTGLRLPTDELAPAARARLQERRQAPTYVQLLVPDNDRYRARIDGQLARYHDGHAPATITDRDRVDMMLEFAASRERSILEEVVKVEYGMARHVLRTQVLVLRYAKALLVLVTTAGATFAASAVVQGRADAAGPTTGQLQGVALILAWWAPAVVFAVTSPVHWLMRILKRDAAGARLVREDREITHFEDIAVRCALGGWVAAAFAGAVLAGDGGARQPALAFATQIASGACLLATLVRWDGRRFAVRLLGRHRPDG